MGVLALIAGLTPSLFSQERSKTLAISRIEAPPRIDGLVDDECWRGREPVSGFFQYDPVNGSKASEETLVW
ncbi:MAG: hypothetical protein NTU62_19800, partial [Spirochaetes bacterium]|nr:hypothetical protein [Spirochaetota bacterium]